MNDTQDPLTHRRNFLHEKFRYDHMKAEPKLRFTLSDRMDKFMDVFFRDRSLDITLIVVSTCLTAEMITLTVGSRDVGIFILLWSTAGYVSMHVYNKLVRSASASAD